MTAEPIRQQARHLYHRKGRTARYVSKQLALPLDQVLELVRERPLPRCIRPGFSPRVRVVPVAALRSCQVGAGTNATADDG
jgi:hypothetical protein